MSWPLGLAVLLVLAPRHAGRQPVTPGPASPRAVTPAGASCVSGACHSQMGQERYVHGPVAVGACTACHTRKPGVTHPSTEADEKGFELVAQGGALCATCHERKDAAPVVHGPVALGECTACHDPHKGQEKYRLVAAGNALCLGCHLERKEEFALRKFSPHARP